MRVSTQQLFDRGLSNIQDVSSELQKTQLQISSGKRVQRPSDDPVASTRIMQINQDLEVTSQYQRNIDLVENRLRQEDDLLSGINDIVIRIRELTIQSGDGSQNADDKRFIAAEVKERIDQLAGMMNSRDASGEYIFGGFQGTDRPFEKNASGTYEYSGDEGRRFLQIDSSVKVAAGDNGKQVFVDVDSANKTFYTGVNPNNQAEPAATITTGQIIDQAQYDAFYPKDMIVQFNVDQTLVTPPGPNFTILERDSGKVVFNPQSFASGQPISANGVQFEIIGDPAPGDTFFIQSTAKQGVLATVEKLVYGLEHFQISAEGRAAFDAMIEDTLQNLESAQTSIIETRAEVGARLNTIDSTREMHFDVEILTKEILSKLQDVDFAAATSELALEEFILQAAYSTFTRVTSLTLFDQI
jgi:flagellar hook-associated protein 3 FlgL